MNSPRVSHLLNKAEGAISPSAETAVNADGALVAPEIQILHGSKACPGIRPRFNDGANCCLSWSYGLIPHLGFAWNLSIINDVLMIYAQNCTSLATMDGSACRPCRDIARSEKYAKVQGWITHGTPENIPHIFRSMGNCLEVIRRKDRHIDTLKLKGVNNTRKL